MIRFSQYHSMKGQKLPKKYQQKQGVSIAPVNAFVPPQSKLSKNELREQLNKEAEERKLKAQKDNELRKENKRKGKGRKEKKNNMNRVFLFFFLPKLIFLDLTFSQLV